MVRRVLSLVLGLQLLLPSYALQTLLAAADPAPASQEASQAGLKVCPCNGKVGCKCCGCDDDDPDAESAPAPALPDPDPGPHGCLCCPCKVAEALAAPSVYLPERSVMFRTLCQPQQELLAALTEFWLSPVTSIESPPPKDRA